MTSLVLGSSRTTIDPLKHSQSLGGVLAMLGMARSMPLIHGVQGCSAFAKSLLTRHFREPIPLQTTALTEVSTILGAQQNLEQALTTITQRHSPALIGVLTTGVTEICGELLTGFPRLGNPLIVAVSTPDYQGGMGEGWSSALLALVAAATHLGDLPVDERGVAVLPGVSLTAADIDDLSGLVRDSGLHPLVVPDISRSLDGHLAEAWSPLTTGGSSVEDLAALPGCATVLAVGASAHAAALHLSSPSGRLPLSLGHCGGLTATDALVTALTGISGQPAGEWVRRWRQRLADALLDSHFVLGGARIALALEPEHLVGVATILAEAGATISVAISPTASPVLAALPCDEVIIGDLVDLEERAAEGGADLLIASSHARALAARLGVPHLAEGFPVYDRLGTQLRGWCGYRGGIRVLFDAANQLMAHT